MPRRTDAPPRRSIATRKGDDGTTSLLYGERVAKDHPQVAAVGSLDEFNAALGLAKAGCRSRTRRVQLECLQRDLVAFMGEVACAESGAARFARSKFPRISDADLRRVDGWLESIEARQPRFEGWATPGANAHAAALEVARTAARRAERALVGLLSHGRKLRPLLLRFINRVSDLLWLMAREAEGR